MFCIVLLPFCRLVSFPTIYPSKEACDSETKRDLFLPLSLSGSSIVACLLSPLARESVPISLYGLSNKLMILRGAGVSAFYPKFVYLCKLSLI